jgi:O-6-methylguanine DNA methyltransferase
MPVAKRKLGLADVGEIYVVNVKSDPEFIGMISRTAGYMPGYHMNKQHWLTVFLDGTVPVEQIFDRVDESFNLVTDSPSKRIYEAVRKIPKGKVATYGQVAELAGNKKMARAVGNALHRNPDPDSIPCYRVVNAKGELAGEFAFGGAGEQAKLLMADGIEVVDGKVDLEKYGMKIIQNH